MADLWKDVVGFEGIYQVSNEGRVRSLDRVSDRGRRLKGKVLATAPGGRTGEYRSVQLFFLNGDVKREYVHRLVAEAFLGTPKEGLQVNHIDENKANNKVTNLEWVTPSENINYGSRNEKDIAKKSKPVEQLTKAGKLVARYASATEAQRKTKVWRTHISACCLGKAMSAGGFLWRFA